MLHKFTSTRVPHLRLEHNRFVNSLFHAPSQTFIVYRKIIFDVSCSSFCVSPVHVLQPHWLEYSRLVVLSLLFQQTLHWELCYKPPKFGGSMEARYSFNPWGNHPESVQKCRPNCSWCSTGTTPGTSCDHCCFYKRQQIHDVFQSQGHTLSWPLYHSFPFGSWQFPVFVSRNHSLSQDILPCMCGA